MATIHELTPRTPDAATETFDPDGILDTTAPYFRTPLSQLHPGLARETAHLFLYAGLSPSCVLCLPGGDGAFSAEVAAAMATSRPG